ncbi:hypothetical protein TOPH_07740 [Tolypocladium ophioglossoides CBS 100239]|uniref:Uncharacterized protein n=1 Tax=Tolypocladium ophioglossoides (strain CBS 100239) TaxID=1163406 RepID=A0A0L0N0T4_TOLOC|nr:hypothetical protein TOPH_07740 [Tolypocladium ophioglossoides CBS 100239]
MESGGCPRRLVPQGPFSTVAEHFTAVAKAALRKAKLRDEKPSLQQARWPGFLDIMQTTGLFEASQAYYPLNHMDLDTQAS